MTVDRRTLVLLRHAKAEPHGDGDDAARELARKGRGQAGRVGRQLRDRLGVVDVALVSAAVRARQTFELLDLAAARTVVCEPLYQATPGEVLELLRDLPAQAGTVLVVGHEPTISGLAAILDGADDDLAQQVRLGVSTATACVLTTEVAWRDVEPGRARLRCLLRP